jgi:putative membrane protein
MMAADRTVRGLSKQLRGNEMSATPDADPRTSLATARTELANFRTALALDRTTLAWVRTTLTMASFGFGTIGFFRTFEERAQTPAAARLHRAAIHFGEWLVLLGIVATVLAGISHWRTLRQIERGEQPHAARWPLSITIAMLISLLGAAGIWTLIAN